MKIHRLFLLFVLAISIFAPVLAQTKPLLKRTTYKTDKLDFGAGGTLSVVGAPVGSIRIEGWPNREIGISAEIEVQAETEADIAKLSEVTTFLLDETIGRTGIISVGAHNKQYLKRIDKKFPKHLASMPYRIDYVIKVPQYTDLQIDGGKGELVISGVEGTMKLNYLETNASLNLVGGSVTAVFGSGSVEVTVPTARWRGRFADIQLAKGSLDVHLPSSLNAEVDAVVLRTGKIENGYSEFKPRVRKAEFTDKLVVAKSGVGGATLKFTVGDGTLKIMEANRPG